MSYYYKQVVKPVLHVEKQAKKGNKADRVLFQRAGRLLRLQDGLLSPRANLRLQTLLERCERLRIVYNYRQSLQAIWLKTATSQKELVEALQQWCKQAEESGLDVLKQFSKQIKAYVPKPIRL